MIGRSGDRVIGKENQTTDDADQVFAAGVQVWPMVEFEADDALAARAVAAARARRLERVIICTPDKDLDPQIFLYIA